MNNIRKQISRPILIFIILILLFGIGPYLLVTFYPSVLTNGLTRLTSLFSTFTKTVSTGTTRTPQQIQESVLAASKSASFTGKVDFNIPIIFNDTAEFKKDVLFDGNIGILGSLTVNGKKIDGSTVPLAGPGITIAAGAVPTITNNGVTSFNGQKGDVTFTGSSGLTISGTTITNSGVTSLDGQTGAVVLTGAGGITVDGTTITNTDPGSAQNIFKNFIIGTTTIAASSNTDSLTFSGAGGITLSNIGKTIIITGAAQPTQFWQDLAGALSPTTSSDDLLIGGSSTASAKFHVVSATGAVITQGNLNVSGVTTLLSNATVGGTLGVTGDTTLTGNLAVNGGNITTSQTTASLFNTTATTINLGGVATALNIGAVTGTTAVRNNETVAGTLGVTGNTTLSTLLTSGNIVDGGNLSVSGAATVSGNTTVGGTFGVTGNTTLSTLSTTGSISDGGNLSVSGAATVSGNTTVGGTFGVTGNTTLAGVTSTSLNNSGNTTLGTNTGNTVSINGLLNTSLLPSSTAINLGSISNNFGTVYAQNVVTTAQSGQNGFWQLNNGALSSTNVTNDLLIGGTSTSSALFQISGTTGSASTSGTLSFNNATNAIVQAAVAGYTTLNGNRYAFVRSVTVTNNSSTQTMGIGQQVTIALSGAALTDICTNTQSNSNDLRMAFNTTEISRNITRSCNSSLSISFTLQAALAPLASTNAYYIYYDSANVAALGSGPTYSYPPNVQLDSMDSAGSWSSTDNVNMALSQETTIKEEGTGSLKIVQTAQSSGSVGSWSSTSQAQLPQQLNTHTTVTATIGGTSYLYTIGGLDGGASTKSTVYKAQLDGSGNVGTWSTTTQGQLPKALTQPTTSTASIGGNIYLYTIGGQNSGFVTQSTVYKAQLDGSGNVGAWSTTSQGQLPEVLVNHNTVTASVGGSTFIYAIGGGNNDARSVVYKAQIDGSGNIGIWSTTSQGQLPQSVLVSSTVAVSISGTTYLYNMGGFNAGSYYSTVYKAQIDGSGNVGTWSTANQGQLPVAIYQPTSVNATIAGQNFVYVMAGFDGGSTLSTVYRSQVDNSGNMGTWSTTGQGQLPQQLYINTAVSTSVGGSTYIYIIGGHTNSGVLSTVYKALIQQPPAFIASRTISSTDLSNYNGILFDAYSSQTGSTMNFQFSNDGGSTWQTFPFSVTSANTWQTIGLDISGIAPSSKNTVTKLRFQTTNSSVGFTAYLDDIEAAPTTFNDLAPTLAAAAAAAASSSNLAINAQGSGVVNLNYDPTNNYAGNHGITVYNGATTKVFSVDGVGNTIINGGNGALSTAATNGFLYLSSSAGKPIGVPTSYAGNVATEYDTTNNKSCVYNAGWVCSGAYSDYAEWAPAAGASAGDLVSLTNEKNPIYDATAPFMLGKSQNPYDSTLIGVVSQYAEDENSANGYKKSADYHAIALAGRVPVKVSTSNGPIQTGDMLTSSSIPGTAMKATKAGIIIGRATQDYSASDSASVGSIIAFIQPGYADPSVVIADSGNLTNAQTLSTTLPMTTSALPGLASGDTSAASSSAITSMNDQLANLTNSVQTLQNQVASLSAQQVIASTSADLQGQVTTLTKAVDLLMTTQLNGNPLSGSISSSSADTLTLTNAFTVTGKTTLSDVGVTGTIQAGLLTIDGLTGTLNTLAGDLKLQSSGLNGIDLENGKVTIDTSGNIVSESSITANKFIVNEDTTSASVGEGVIPAGKSSITILAPAITDRSHVFTSYETLFDVPLVVTQKKARTSFTIQIAKPAPQDLKFSWWILN